MQGNIPEHHNVWYSTCLTACTLYETGINVRPASIRTQLHSIVIKGNDVCVSVEHVCVRGHTDFSLFIVMGLGEWCNLFLEWARWVIASDVLALIGICLSWANSSYMPLPPFSISLFSLLFSRRLAISTTGDSASRRGLSVHSTGLAGGIFERKVAA